MPRKFDLQILHLFMGLFRNTFQLKRFVRFSTFMWKDLPFCFLFFFYWWVYKDSVLPFICGFNLCECFKKIIWAIFDRNGSFVVTAKQINLWFVFPRFSPNLLNSEYFQIPADQYYSRSLLLIINHCCVYCEIQNLRMQFLFSNKRFRWKI